MSITKISKKSGTRYRARIRVENGKQISKVFRRKVDAEAWEREQLRLRDRPDLRPPKAADLTIEELFTAWRKHHASRHLAPSTAKMYLSRINRYILPAFGDMLATEIVVGHLDDCMGELEALELHPKTINDTLTILGGLYRWGMKRFDLPRNPCADVQKLTIDPSDFDFWSQGEVEQFLDATIEHPYRDAFVMAINTGARFGELTGLKWDCVHFGRNQLVISRSWCQASSKLRNRTKGGKTRNLPMNATVRDLLLRRKSESQSDFVLTNADGIHKLPNRLCGDHFRPACLDAIERGSGVGRAKEGLAVVEGIVEMWLLNQKRLHRKHDTTSLAKRPSAS